jgi:uncharacterized membrane protein
MLSLLFSFSMIVSHYSVAYVGIALLLFTYLVSIFYKRTNNINFLRGIYNNLKFKKRYKPKNKILLSGGIVLILIILTFFWYGPLTGISGDLVHVVDTSLSNMNDMFSGEMKSSTISGILSLDINQKSFVTDTDVKEYYQTVSSEYTNKMGNSLYDKKKYTDYSIMSTNSKSLPFISSEVSQIILPLNRIVSSLIKLFLALGLVSILIINFKETQLCLKYLAISLGCGLMIAAIIIMPYISLSYNFERLYLQALVVLSLPAILGGFVLFWFIKNRHLKSIIIIFLFICFFLFNSGFVTQLTGGTPTANLNNFGVYYNQDYTRHDEVQSIHWLSNNHDKNSLIYVDKASERKLMAYGRIINGLRTDLLPSTIGKNSYVYLSYANIVEKQAFKLYKGKMILYNTPEKFLNENKNLVYNNGGSTIFK